MVQKIPTYQEHEKVISDKEWEKFLEDIYSNVRYGKPDKHATANFLIWRKNQVG